MNLIYPAVFAKMLHGEGYTVTVPDLPGCVTEGADLAEALTMAEDAASGWVLDELEDGKPAPKSTAPELISLAPGEFLSLLLLDMDTYTEKYGRKSVRKNLTIPAWLNTYAEARGINYSRLLTKALQEEYNSATGT